MREVEVNEARVFATVTSADYWSLFRLRGPDSRFRVLTASLGGDLVAVACDDLEDAKWLCGHLVDHGGLPKSAVRVLPQRRNRTPPAG